MKSANLKKTVVFGVAGALVCSGVYVVYAGTDDASNINKGVQQAGAVLANAVGSSATVGHINLKTLGGQAVQVDLSIHHSADNSKII